MEINLKQACPVCKSNNTSALSLPYKTFRHLDFSEFSLSNGNVLCECADCGAVFRLFDSNGMKDNKELSKITELYKSEKYLK